jgi:hypothetical protein
MVNGAEQTAAAAAGKETEQANQKQPFPAGLRVLLVDDDPVCLMVIGQMLRACQYEGGLVGVLFCSDSLRLNGSLFARF